MASPLSCSFCPLEQKRRGKKKDIRNGVGLEGDAGNCENVFYTRRTSAGARTPVQNSVAFRQWVLQVPKYHLVPEYRVKTLNTGTGSVPELCEFLDQV